MKNKPIMSNNYFLGIWIGLLLLHYLFTRTRRFNNPVNTLEDCGDFVRIQASGYQVSWWHDVISIEKKQVVKIQRSKSTVSLFTRGNNAFDIWVVGKFNKELFERAKHLFPLAQVVEINSKGEAVTQERQV